MKKSKLLIVIISIIVGLLIGTIYILNMIGYVSNYKVSSIVMGPGIKKDKNVICIKSKELKVNDIIMFNAEPLQHENKTNNVSIISRIVAGGLDKVEMKNGKLYINDKFVDDTLKLSYYFLLSHDDISEISKNKNFDENIMTFGDSLIINTNYPELSKYNITGKAKRFLAQYKLDSKIFNCNNDYWTLENFGPIIIPENNFFVLGDNRSNSADSRLRGFVKKEKVIGKIVFIY